MTRSAQKILSLVFFVLTIFSLLYFPPQTKSENDILDLENGTSSSADSTSLNTTASAQANDFTFADTGWTGSTSKVDGVAKFFELSAGSATYTYALAGDSFWRFDPVANRWQTAGLFGPGCRAYSPATNRGLQTIVYNNMLVVGYDAQFCGGNFNSSILQFYKASAGGAIVMHYDWRTVPDKDNFRGPDFYNAGGFVTRRWEFVLKGNLLYVLYKPSSTQALYKINFPNGANAPTSLVEVCTNNTTGPLVDNVDIGNIVGFYNNGLTTPIIGLYKEQPSGRIKPFKLVTEYLQGTTPWCNLTLDVLYSGGSPLLLGSNFESVLMDTTLTTGGISAGALYYVSGSPSNCTESGNIAFINATAAAVPFGYRFDYSLFKSRHSGAGCPGTGNPGIVNGFTYLYYNFNQVEYSYAAYTECNGIQPALGARVTSCVNGTAGQQLVRYAPGPVGTQINVPVNVQVTNSYFSNSLKKIFFSTKTDQNSAPSELLAFNQAPNNSNVGIFVHHLTTPIIDKCDSVTITPDNSLELTSRAATILVRGTTNNMINAKIDFIHSGSTVLSFNPDTVALDTAGVYDLTFVIQDYLTEPGISNAVSNGVTSMQIVIRSPNTTGYSTNPLCRPIITFADPGEPTITNYQTPGGGFLYTCSTTQVVNPYQLRMTLTASPSRVPGATVNKIVAVIMPEGTPVQNITFGTTGPNAGRPSFPPGFAVPYFIADSNTAPGNFSTNNSQTVTITNMNLPAGGTGGAQKTASFNVNFSPFLPNGNPNTFLQSFYGTQTSTTSLNSFVAMVYVSDTTGRTNLLTGNVGQFTSTQTTDPHPLDACAALYYKTSNGDIRSVEPRPTTGKAPFAQYDRVLRIVSGSTLQGTNAEGTDRSRIPTLRISDYSYQYYGSGNCTTIGVSLSKMFPVNGDFCKQVGVSSTPNITTDDLKLQKQISNFTTSLVDSVGNPNVVTINKTVSGAAPILNINNTEIPGANPNAINIVKITGQAGMNITIIDTGNSSGSGANLNNLVLWCATSGCRMTVRARTAANNLFSINAANNPSLLSTLVPGVVDQSRLYFNPNGPIILSEANANQQNFLNGAFVTGDYLYTPQAYRTTVINGLIASKGIVARSGSQTVNSNASLYFRDFWNFAPAAANQSANPFLYIQYDPKYLYTLSKLNVVQAENVPRELVGI